MALSGNAQYHTEKWNWFYKRARANLASATTKQQSCRETLSLLRDAGLKATLALTHAISAQNISNAPAHKIDMRSRATKTSRKQTNAIQTLQVQIEDAFDATVDRCLIKKSFNAQ